MVICMIMFQIHSKFLFRLMETWHNYGIHIAEEIYVPFGRLDIRSHSISITRANLWNLLPVYIKNILSFILLALCEGIPSQWASNAEIDSKSTGHSLHYTRYYIVVHRSFPNRHMISWWHFAPKRFHVCPAPIHYLNQWWRILNSTLRNTFQWNIIWNSVVSIHRNAFENIVCEMAAMLSRPKCVKYQSSVNVQLSANQKSCCKICMN